MKKLLKIFIEQLVKFMLASVGGIIKIIMLPFMKHNGKLNEMTDDIYDLIKSIIDSLKGE